MSVDLAILRRGLRVATIAALAAGWVATVGAADANDLVRVRRAIAYLDARQDAWSRSDRTGRGEGADRTTCVSCHTGISYALARPALGRFTAGPGRAAPEERMLAQVGRRVEHWAALDSPRFRLMYDSDDRKKAESRGTEAVLNALVLARDDAARGRATIGAATQAALRHLWATQATSGSDAGSWDWLNFGLEPWEANDSRPFGAALAAIAVGSAPGYLNGELDDVAARGVARLRDYLRRRFPEEGLYNRLWILEASNAVPGLLSADQGRAVVDQLLALQREDGGWALADLGDFERVDGTDQARDSDGYATGLALHVLRRAVPAAARPAVIKGLDWLRSHQRDDGSWPGRSVNKERDPATFAGKLMTDAATAIAALALVEAESTSSLPAARAAAEQDEPRQRPALAAYFPPPEDRGGWRSLLPERGEPDAEQKAKLREAAGVDWDKLREAWRHNEAAPGASGLLVIRRGYVVGEWYKDCDRATEFNIYSCSKAYTSTAFGLILDDFGHGESPGGKRLSLATKVCNADWLPEALPLTDPRKAEITVRHLLHMASGLGEENPPDPPGSRKRFEPEGKVFEWFLGHVEGSPMAKLKDDPGKAFHYSNAGVAHLVLLFQRAAGEDLFPFLKRRLFEPIGMAQVRWLTIGGDGAVGPYSQGYSGVTTTAREHARFCYLALNRGEWAGRRIVPDAYYDFAWAPSPVQRDYGAQWWIHPHHKDAPRDLVQTAGFRNNHGYVVPSLDLVFVRVGNGDEYPKDFESELVTRVVAAVEPR